MKTRITVYTKQGQTFTGEPVDATLPVYEFASMIEQNINDLSYVTVGVDGGFITIKGEDVLAIQVTRKV